VSKSVQTSFSLGMAATPCMVAWFWLHDCLITIYIGIQDLMHYLSRDVLFV